MMTLYCDESDDGHTYALAGWLSVPSGWDRFEPAWRDMLKTVNMPDGSPCRAFHAADIVGRDSISDSYVRRRSQSSNVLRQEPDLTYLHSCSLRCSRVLGP